MSNCKHIDQLKHEAERLCLRLTAAVDCPFCGVAARVVMDERYKADEFYVCDEERERRDSLEANLTSTSIANG